MKKVAENNKAVFYTNHMTESAEEYAESIGVNVKCYIAESKRHRDRDYVLVRDNQMIYASPQYEAIAVRIDVLSLLNRDIWTKKLFS